MDNNWTDKDSKAQENVAKVSFLDLYLGIMDLYRLVDEYGDTNLKVKFSVEIMRILKMDEREYYGNK
jgi:hypothetical protein